MYLRVSVFDKNDVLGDAIDEVAIVRNDDECAGELLEGFFERFARVDVEVIRRLVKEHQIAAVVHDLRERKPSLFAAGEVARFLVNVIIKK